MQHTDFISDEDRVRALEQDVERSIPGSVALLSRGKRAIVLQAQLLATDLTADELQLLGAVVKLATLYGNTVIAGEFAGVS
ncbi:MAG TPA: hypothetical protein VD837_17595 [Terriglobales bacterium]|nr:hypothetical protein [Terriglobales bacterium]